MIDLSAGVEVDWLVSIVGGVSDMKVKFESKAVVVVNSSVKNADGRTVSELESCASPSFGPVTGKFSGRSALLSFTFPIEESVRCVALSGTGWSTLGVEFEACGVVSVDWIDVSFLYSCSMDSEILHLMSAPCFY